MRTLVDHGVSTSLLSDRTLSVYFEACTVSEFIQDACNKRYGKDAIKWDTAQFSDDCPSEHNLNACRILDATLYQEVDHVVIGESKFYPSRVEGNDVVLSTRSFLVHIAQEQARTKYANDVRFRDDNISRCKRHIETIQKQMASITKTLAEVQMQFQDGVVSYHEAKDVGLKFLERTGLHASLQEKRDHLSI